MSLHDATVKKKITVEKPHSICAEADLFMYATNIQVSGRHQYRAPCQCHETGSLMLFTV